MGFGFLVKYQIPKNSGLLFKERVHFFVRVFLAIPLILNTHFFSNNDDDINHNNPGNNNNDDDRDNHNEDNKDNDKDEEEKA